MGQRGEFVLLGLLLLFALTACGAPEGRAAPKATLGELDLRGWDLESDGPAPFDGQWSLSWGELGDAPRGASDYATLPGTFADFVLHDGTRPGPHGAATFRLHVLMPQAFADAAPGAFSMDNGAYYGAYRLEVRDGAGAALTEPLHGGALGRTAETSRDGWVPLLAPLAPARDLYVTLQVSDFEEAAGVVPRAPSVGPTRTLVTERRAHDLREVILIGTIFMMGLYHLILYALRRAERAPLWLALFCFAVGTRSLLYGRYIEQALGDVAFTRRNIQLQYVAIYLGAVFFSLFLRALFPAFAHRRIANTIVAASLLLVAVELALPAAYAVPFRRAFELSLFAMNAWAIVVLATAVVRAKDGMAARLLAGFFLLGLAIMNDVLLTLGVLHGPSLVSWGLFAFILSQTLVLAMHNQRARTAAELYARELDLARAKLEKQNAELDAKNVALSRLDQLKDSFLANTSHELRTPLHGIIGIAESLVEGARGLLPESAASQLRLVVASARRLTSLVNDLLDFSKLKHRTIDLKLDVVDLRAVVDVVLTLSEPTIRGKPLVLTNEVPEKLALALADENRLQQILLNLVGNAVKFTAAGRVSISAREDGGMLAVTVADTGIGIAREVQERIFESFEQGDGTTSREYGGTGLGLTITKQLVALHGGTIWVDSQPGAGARFTFTLRAAERTPSNAAQDHRSRPGEAATSRAGIAVEPADDAPPPSSRTWQMHTGQGGPRIRVLAVDDDPVNLAVVEGYLSSSRFALATATSGQRALDLLDRPFRFDIVLLDIMMPRMTGYEVCRRIRLRQGPNELPILLLTAKSQVSDLVEGFDAGANDYLTKPFAKRELIARIVAHTQIAKTNRAYRRFVPHEIVTLLGKEDVTDVRLGDQVERKMSVLFSDIRFFTTLSETMSPKQTFAFVDDCLRRISPSVRAEGGFVDKYLGDGIMALFPRGVDDAVRAGLAMLDVVRADAARSGGRIEMGVGLHTGDVVLGVLGEEQRMEGTVIADAVNLASRIESCTKVLGASFLVSGDAFSALAEPERYAHRALGRVRVKGKTKATPLYELFEGDPPALRQHKAATKDAFARGVAFYTEGALEDAAAVFADIVGREESDGPARFYLARCRDLAKAGSPASFSGVLDVEVK